MNLLHKEQIHLEKNLKMLVHKMGVAPSNTLLSEEKDVQMLAAIRNMTITDDNVDEELKREFDRTANAFDQVLEDCSQLHPDTISPPPKKNKSNTSASLDQSEGGGMEE